MPELLIEAAQKKREQPVSRAAAIAEFEVCIVGAGVAGCALAWHLGRQGVSVALVERDLSEPEKIIGELLQPGGVIQLRDLGLHKALNGFDAQEIEGYALFMNEKHFNISYPSAQGRILTGRGFRYGKFIMKLRECLREIPSVAIIEGAAHDLVESANGVVSGIRYMSSEENEKGVIHARTTIICDGGFSKFRARLNQSQPQVRGFMVGMILKNCELPYPRHGHVFLGGASPFLSYPVSSTETRVLIDFPGEQAPRKDETFQRYLRETVFRQLPLHMRSAFALALEENKFKAMPAMMVASKPFRKPGVVLLGDSLNMRHPLTGGGMTVALTDARLLGDLLLKTNSLNNESDVHRATEEFYRQRHSANATINILADALYGVMSHSDLKRACFDYLRKGGSYVQAPISILSAVSRDKNLLIRKFFSVAMFGAGNLLRPFPEVKNTARAYGLLKTAVRIISPLLLNENPSKMTKALIKTGEWLFPENNNSATMRHAFLILISAVLDTALLAVSVSVILNFLQS